MEKIFINRKNFFLIFVVIFTLFIGFMLNTDRVYADPTSTPVPFPTDYQKCGSFGCDGSACAQDWQCNSGICRNGKCAPGSGGGSGSCTPSCFGTFYDTIEWCETGGGWCGPDAFNAGSCCSNGFCGGVKCRQKGAAQSCSQFNGDANSCRGKEGCTWNDPANTWSAWGACSATCGGGTQTRTNGCGQPQSQACLTQACVPTATNTPPSPIPNCTALAGPTQITVGQSGTYVATFTSAQGNLGGEIVAGQNGQFIWAPGSKSIGGTSGPLSFTWIPTTAGTYDVFCRAWNDAIAECRGKQNYVDGPPRYPCQGPLSSLTVNVVTGTSTPTPVIPCPRKPQGDANCDGKIDGVDYSIWLNSQCHPAARQTCSKTEADFNKDGNVDDADYQIWFTNRGT